MAGGRGGPGAAGVRTGLIRPFLSNRPDCRGMHWWWIVRRYWEQRRSPVKKLLIASMLAAFGAAIVLPVLGSDDAFAATKKSKTKMEKPLKKKPSGKM